MILELLQLVIIFIITWFVGFFLHELWHLFICQQYGGIGRIRLTNHKGISSAYCECDGCTERFLFKLMGGLGTAIFLIPIGIALFSIYTPLGVSLFIVGLVNLPYSFYEATFLDRWNKEKYMKWHYVLYGIMIMLGLIITGQNIINYLGG